MDCEKFDQHVIDALYDELDELTHAALKRHMEGCSRCAGVWAGLRATRDVGVLPLVEPPDDLEAKILDAVTVAQKTVPFHKKVLRAMAWAGSHAMRPQLAMAAIFFLVIGSSLLLLRPRLALSPVAVTENGAPAAAEPPAAAARERAVAQAAATASPTAAPAPAEGAADDARPADGAGRAAGKAATAAKADEVAEADKDSPSGADARNALSDAITTRDTSGCAAAVAKLDAVAVRFPGTKAAADAMWAEAGCYKQMGDAARAQQLYLSLRSTGYRDRAQAELDDANRNTMGNAQQIAAAPAAAPPPAATAAPAASAVADAEAKRGGYGNAGRANKAAAPAAPKAPARPAPARQNAGFAP
jgi:hypothetical protein